MHHMYFTTNKIYWNYITNRKAQYQLSPKVEGICPIIIYECEVVFFIRYKKQLKLNFYRHS